MPARGCVAGLYDGLLGEGRRLPMSLGSLGSKCGVSVARPREGALVLVVGDQRSGKTAFVNLLVQELTGASRKSRSVSWTKSGSGDQVPPLLAEFLKQHPHWNGNTAGLLSSADSREELNGVDVVEFSPPGSGDDAEMFEFLSQRADIVVCLMDAQKQPVASADFLDWVSKLPLWPASSKSCANVQFVLSKIDHWQRCSDREKVVMKASRLLMERLGRRVEVVPMAAPNVVEMVLESAMGPAPVIRAHGREFRRSKPSTEPPEAVLLARIATAAQQAVEQRQLSLHCQLGTDCTALRTALEQTAGEALQRGSSTSNSLRRLCVQASVSLAIVAVALPYILEGDFALETIYFCSRCLAALVGLLLFCAFVSPTRARLLPQAEQDLAELLECKRAVAFIDQQRQLAQGEPAT